MAFFGLRHPLSYPSILTAIVVGSSSLLYLIGTIPETLATPSVSQLHSSEILLVSILLLCSYCALLVVGAGWHSLRNSKHPSLPSEGHIEPSLTLQELVNWLQTDDAILSRSNDRFSLVPVADRIVDRLMLQSPPAQAIVGDLGAGKSSLKRLVIEALSARTSQITIVPVELWPYETSRAAVEGTIARIVGSLEAHVEVLSARGISAEYVRAMSASGGFISALARLSGPPESPIATLHKLDRIATSIDQRFVIWVEDLERFAGHGQGHETPAEAEKLNPIRSLLYAIDQLSAFNVVTATTSLHRRMDIEKIARFVEEVPAITIANASQIFACFRKGCLDAYPDDLDPAEREAREVLNALHDPLTLDLRQDRPNTKDVADRILEVTHTPRALKHSLRETYETWQHLHGEIDFDDLFAMNTLRASSPAAFAVVQDNIRELARRGDTEGYGTEAPKYFPIDIEKAVGTGPAWTLALAVVEFVFEKSNAKRKPQGLRDGRYWQRYLGGVPISETESDQHVLHTLERMDEEEILTLLEGEQSGSVENFASFIGTERLLALLCPLIVRRSAESASLWKSDGGPRVPGFIRLWRMWRRRCTEDDFPTETAFNEVMEAFRIAVPHNLYLVAELEEYFVVANAKKNMLRASGTSHDNWLTNTKQTIRDLVVNTFRDQPERLADALDGARARTLLRICWGIDRVRDRDTGRIPFPKWNEFAPTILEATKNTPQTMVPQLTQLVVTHDEKGIGESTPKFNEEAAQTLFGMSDLRAALEGQTPGGWPKSKSVRALLRAMERSPAKKNVDLDATRVEN